MMSDRRDPDVHRLVMDWPDDAIAEIERLRYAIKLERGKTEKADADNDALRSRLAERDRQVDKWARFSESHGWLDAQEFTEWIAYLQRRLAEAELSRDSWKREARLNQQAADESAGYARRLAEAERDSQRLDWLERHLFEGKWDGTIGRPKSWYMAGPYRHTLQRMRGDALREAIDLAMQADSAAHREDDSHD